MYVQKYGRRLVKPLRIEKNRNVKQRNQSSTMHGDREAFALSILTTKFFFFFQKISKTRRNLKTSLLSCSVTNQVLAQVQAQLDVLRNWEETKASRLFSCCRVPSRTRCWRSFMCSGMQSMEDSGWQPWSATRSMSTSSFSWLKLQLHQLRSHGVRHRHPSLLFPAVNVG